MMKVSKAGYTLPLIVRIWYWGSEDTILEAEPSKHKNKKAGAKVAVTLSELEQHLWSAANNVLADSLKV